MKSRGSGGKSEKQKAAKETSRSGAPKKSKKAAAGNQFDLRLYIAGQTPKSLAALSNLRKICETYLDGKYRIEVIDLMKTPQLAQGDQILAIPTLVKNIPVPIRKIIGDLSNTERVLVGLDLRPAEGSG